MNRPTWTSAAALSALLGTGLFALNAMAAPEEEKPSPPAVPTPPTTPAPPPVDPKTIWPAGLKELAGKYQFIQVASPGGLWARTGSDARQVSLNELSPTARERLRKAELVISDLQFESPPEAREVLSPSRRGNLRFYSESAIGKLALHNIPGIGGDDEDKGEYTGRAVFNLEHQSHSNPSVSGIVFQRMQQEATWGAATLDFADLEAVPLVEGKPTPRRRRPAAPGSTTQRPVGPTAAFTANLAVAPEASAIHLIADPAAKSKQAPPTTPAPEQGAPESDDEGPLPVIMNARVLRSGIEIVAFVKWSEKKNGKSTTYNGSVRLIKMDEFRRIQEKLGAPPSGGRPGVAPPVRPQPPAASS